MTRDGAISNDDLLTDDEVLTLLVRLGESRGAQGFTEQDGVRLVRWATEVRVGQSMLHLLLAGQEQVELPAEGEPVFSARETARASRQRPSTRPPVSRGGAGRTRARR